VTRLVTVAHGTRLAAGNLVAAELTVAAGTALGIDATASYVELCEPSLPEVLADSAEPTVVVPLLLSTGHHARHDLPSSLRAARGQVRLGPPLGPHPRVARAQVDRLLHCGAVPGEPVVMVAAGSRDPLALRDLQGAVRALRREWAGPVRLATLGGLGPRAAEVVTPDCAVSPYLLAEGHFADRLRESCAPAYAVADVLGAHPELVALVAERARALAAGSAERLVFEPLVS
jgi:sirohydrochlorin ferrochelatase